MNSQLDLNIDKYTKEELEPGAKYFVLIHNILLAFILYFFLEGLNCSR